MSQAKQRVGEYVLDDAVGECPYAQVWSAHHHLWTDQLATVKIPTEANYIGNLNQPAVHLPRMTHPNIAQPLGFDPTANPPYLVTEFLAGGTLRPWIAKRKLTVEQSINILRQVLTALQYAFERGVVHGDIKPDNILLTATAVSSNFAEPGSVKVADFGVGVAMALTAVGAGSAAVGTDRMAYLAPEQRTGSPPDVRTDIYAVGVTLFEMLTGERPSGAELPSDLNPDVPPWLDEVFRKSYARRERRFDTPQHFLAALPVDPHEEQGILQLAPAPAEPAPPPRAPAARAAAPPVASPPKQTISIAPPPARPAAPPVMKEIPVAPPPEPPVSQSFSALDVPLEDDTHSPEEPEEQTVATTAGPATGIAHEPSRAEPKALFDELSPKQVKTPDDLRLALRLFFQGRRMDEGESANIRLRLIKWAIGLSGGQPNLDQNIALNQASNRPLYVAKMITRTMDDRDHPAMATVDHPAERAVQVLQDDDYKVVAHLSGDVIDDKFLEAAPPGPLRNTLVRLAQDARREYWGRVARQDLILYRVNAIVAEYEFDSHPYRAFLAGNNLTVLADSEPFTKIRQEPTKRAANLLDGEQIRLGIRELHRGLDSPQWQAKSGSILSALRGKLSAAYMAEAKDIFDGFGWLESMEMATNAGLLTPSSDAPLQHMTKVRKWVSYMQLFPGLLICVAFVGLAIIWAMNGSQPHTFQDVLVQVLQQPFFIGGIAALIATIWANAVLRTRMARTDVAFYHAMLLPTVIAGILALVAVSENEFRDVTVDIICGISLIVAIVVDWLLFKYLGNVLLRPAFQGDLVGDESLILSKIESMLDKDWDRLQAYYVALGPLYTYTSVQATSWQHPALLDRSGEEENANTFSVAEPPEEAPQAPVDPRVQRLVSQIEAKIGESARALADPARALLAALADYSKAAGANNVSLMQTAAVKVEQKGQELTSKLADFDRLCHAPALADPSRPEQLRAIAAKFAQRTEEPDIQLLRTVADYARNFRANSTQAQSALAPLLPQVNQIIEQLNPQ
jgi:serine/threonine protein kinase